jgi:arylsulfatase A-like enzyme
MIIFTSDHGEEFYEHKGWLHEHSLYNELIKVPLIIKFPNSKYGNKRIKNTVRIIDIVPTILEELRMNFPKNKFDGKSLHNLIKGKEKKERISLGFKFIYLIDKNKSYNPYFLKISIIKDPYKRILNNKYPDKYSFPGFKVPGGPPFSVEEIQFFNLKKDPFEMNNLADLHKEKVQELLEEMNPYYLKALELEKEKQVGKSINKQLMERLKALGYVR